MDYAIIAAGEGSRLVQEGVQWPKPLVRLNGIPLIDRLIDLFLRHNATSISIIINEEMKEVQQHLREKQLPVPFNLVVKSTPSSMHSFYELTPYLTGGKFCLTTVDTIFRENEFAAYIESFEKDPATDGYMAVTPFIDDEKPLYVGTNPSLQITAFTDQATPGTQYVSGGIYGLTQPAIRILAKAIEQNMSRMRNYQRQLVAEGLRLQAFPFPKIIDVDHAEDIAKAEQFLNS